MKEGRPKERMHVQLWLILAVVQQKPAQRCTGKKSFNKKKSALSPILNRSPLTSGHGTNVKTLRSVPTYSHQATVRGFYPGVPFGLVFQGQHPFQSFS